MRALAIHAADDIRLEELPDPQPGPEQVRLRVSHVGICGSDLHYFFHGANGEFRVREPLIPGHELSATVDLDPSGALAPGTPVTVHPARFGHEVPGIKDRPHLWPGGDYLGSAAPFPHRQGAAAELLVVERDMVRPLPEGLPLRRAALAEPLAVALHAVRIAQRTSPDLAGARALVLGCGPIGLLAISALTALGATDVTAGDVRPEPLERARAAGASATVLIGSEDVEDTAYDVVLECSGVPASLSTALRAASRAATVVQVGMLPGQDVPVSLAPLVSKELTLAGTFRFLDEIDAAIELLSADDRFDAVVTHAFGVDQAREAFAVARDSAASGKVLLEM